MKKRNFLIAPLAALAALGLTACGSNEAIENTIPSTQPSQPGQTTTSDPTPSVDIDPLIQNFRVDSSAFISNLYVGETLDTSKIKAYATLKGSTEEQDVTDDITFDLSSFNNMKAGTYYIRAIYKYQDEVKKKDIRINVTSVLTNIDYLIGIEATGAKNTYQYNEALDLTNLVVTAYYKSGETKVLSADAYEVDYTNFNNTMTGSYEIVVKYSESYTASGLVNPDETTEHYETKAAKTCFFVRVDVNSTSVSDFGVNVYYVGICE